MIRKEWEKMTLILIMLVFVALMFMVCWYLESRDKSFMVLEVSTIVIFMIGVFALFAVIISWIPAKKDSEILYTQLLTNHNTITHTILYGNETSKAIACETIVKYNNDVIKAKTNSKRFIFKDFYSQNVDWDWLEVIVFDNTELEPIPEIIIDEPPIPIDEEPKLPFTGTEKGVLIK